MKRPPSLLGQATVFLIVGFAFSMIANAIHPSGVELSRNYFQQAAPEHGFTVIDTEELAEWLEFLSQDEGGNLLLDARGPDSFALGHIPGAILVDHYHQQDYIPAILPALQRAAMVIVYCNGGDCEDSLFLAHDLVYEYGLMPEVLHVYEGGLDAWQAAKLETSLENGGQR